MIIILGLMFPISRYVVNLPINSAILELLLSIDSFYILVILMDKLELINEH